MSKVNQFRPLVTTGGKTLYPGTSQYKFGFLSGKTAVGLGRFARIGGGVLSVGTTLYSGYNFIQNPTLKNGLDTGFGIVGLMGPIGFTLSAGYYIASSPAFIQSSMDYQNRIQENQAKYGAGMRFMENGTLCFGAGTNVTMADGSLKPIELVVIGDMVLTYDFTKERIIKTEVLRTDAPMHSNLVKISFSNKVANSNTQDHPYFVKGKGWCSFNPEQSTERYSLSTSKLEIGDKCFVYQKGKLKKVKITSILEQEGVVKTYNLTGLKFGNSYFANGILVNNESKE